MKVNWSHLIFIASIIALTLVIIGCFYKLAEDHRESERDYLRRCYAPLSESEEIQRAYEAIRNK